MMTPEWFERYFVGQDMNGSGAKSSMWHLRRIELEGHRTVYAAVQAWIRSDDQVKQYFATRAFMARKFASWTRGLSRRDVLMFAKQAYTARADELGTEPPSEFYIINRSREMGYIL